ncbi:elongation factor Tu [Pseudomonas floridensis]|uniref:Elongation factor Tu n=1 Tax=Pseudomonas floridensis TaxID=1958950 RepID=A0A1X0N8F3_9PSED|nr:elongation factor Tu [Pseudomonas floridensis]ORC60017.1 elongation factor Tu [Pseudomonas floridensis]
MEGTERKTVNVCTLGHVDDGKTTLTAALSHVCSESFSSKKVGFDAINAAPEEKFGGITIKVARVAYDSKTRHYEHVDCPSHEDYVKGLISGAVEVDGAILVCSTADGAMSGTRAHVQLCRDVGISHIVVFLSKADLADDEETVKIYEMEVRELLNSYNFHGDDVPVIIGSARMALEEKDDKNRGTSAIKKLIEAMDSHIPNAVPTTDKPFLMPIDVDWLTGPGTVVSGRIERGIIRDNDEVEAVGVPDITKTKCLAIKTSKQITHEGRAGDECTIVLSQIEENDLRPGPILVKPGTIKPHTDFEAVIYVLSGMENGRTAPFLSTYSPQFHFRNADVKGQCKLPEDHELAAPGEYIKISVTLSNHVPLEESLRFTVHDQGKTVAYGIITKIIK